ncbi:MAG TPA: murein biosynthesis integral membrane protein MurJ [Vicinamibacteria bacterium]|nr:murein biosynthesis integral membrane protein MurJ [Vicinamibacteria bacterium]
MSAAVKDVETEPVRAAGTVGVLTLASRVLGMVESRVLAHYLGLGPAADAFFVAFRLPNLLRRFTAEGVMVAAFLPTIHEVEMREGEEASRTFVGRFMGSLTTLLALVTLVGILGMGVIAGFMVLGRVAPGPPLEKLTAWAQVLVGSRSPTAEWSLTILLGRIMFGYLLLVSVSAALGGVLNLKDRFALPAATPILWNVVVIALGIGLLRLFGWTRPDDAALAFSIAVLAGGLAQVALLWPTYRGLGYGLSLGLHLRDPPVARTLRRMGPGILGAGAYQINVLVSTLLASTLAEGAQTVLFNSTMMAEMVLGLFAVSLATVSLPLMTRQAEAGDLAGLRGSLSLGLRSTLLPVLPAAVGMGLLAYPIIALIFETGRFGPDAVGWTARTLVYQAIGIPFIAAARIMVPACYALKDYRGPVRVAVASLAANLVLSLALMGPLGTGGIALANGLASLVSLVLLGQLLERRLGHLALGEVFRAWGRVALATLPMALVAFLGRRALGLDHFQGALGTGLRLLPLITVCALLYASLLWALGSPEARDLLRRLWHRPE